MKKQNIIYIRTSSKHSFKKTSPTRQIQIIKNKYPGIIFDHSFNENESSYSPLKERGAFKQIIKLSKTNKINQYVESASRIGRSFEVFSEFMEINKKKRIVPFKATGLNPFLKTKLLTKN